MNDPEFLRWLYYRLQNRHGEDPDVDYMIRLNSLIKKLEEKSDSNWDYYRSFARRMMGYM